MKPEHPLKDDFSRLSENERVIFAIKGGYTPVSKIHMRGIKDVFYSVINWRQSNNVLILRFEDLVGVKGGGSYSEQIKSLKEICNYLEINVEDKDIEKYVKMLLM